MQDLAVSHLYDFHGVKIRRSRFSNHVDMRHQQAERKKRELKRLQKLVVEEGRKKLDDRPAWDSTVQDLSIHKMDEKSRIRKKEFLQSRNAMKAKVEFREKMDNMRELDELHRRNVTCRSQKSENCREGMRKKQNLFDEEKNCFNLEAELEQFRKGPSPETKTTTETYKSPPDREKNQSTTFKDRYFNSPDYRVPKKPTLTRRQKQTTLTDRYLRSPDYRKSKKSKKSTPENGSKFLNKARCFEDNSSTSIDLYSGSPDSRNSNKSTTARCQREITSKDHYSRSPEYRDINISPTSDDSSESLDLKISNMSARRYSRSPLYRCSNKSTSSRCEKGVTTTGCCLPNLNYRDTNKSTSTLSEYYTSKKRYALEIREGERSVENLFNVKSYAEEAVPNNVSPNMSNDAGKFVYLRNHDLSDAMSIGQWNEQHADSPADSPPHTSFLGREPHERQHGFSDVSSSKLNDAPDLYGESGIGSYSGRETLQISHSEFYANLYQQQDAPSPRRNLESYRDRNICFIRGEPLPDDRFELEGNRDPYYKGQRREAGG